MKRRLLALLCAALPGAPGLACELLADGATPTLALPPERAPALRHPVAAAVPAPPLLEMLPVPGGRFAFGGGPRRGPRPALGQDGSFEVEVSPFLMSRTEVTQAQYAAVMGSNPSLHRGDELPVGRLSWYDAIAFANALSLREGLQPAYRLLPQKDRPGSRPLREFVEWDRSADGYRLATEAEWEFAARAGGTVPSLPGPRGCVRDPALDAIAWHCGNSGGRPQPVATRAPNDYGLHDLLGNANEWVWDWFAPLAAPLEPAPPRNPAGPVSRAASGPFKTLKGGSYLQPASALRADARVGHVNFEYYGHHDFGLRLVRNAPPPPAQRVAGAD